MVATTLAAFTLSWLLAPGRAERRALRLLREGRGAEAEPTR
jgi:hypothetical protein